MENFDDLYKNSMLMENFDAHGKLQCSWKTSMLMENFDDL